MTEDWEYSFQPLDEAGAILPPGICDHCYHPTLHQLNVQKFMDRGVRRTFTFCSDDCRHAFYLNRLKENGL